MDNHDGFDELGVDEHDAASVRLRPELLLAVWSVPALLSCVQQWASSALSNHPTSFWRIVSVEWPGWYLWAALTPGIFHIAQRFPLQQPWRVRVLAAHAVTWSACLMVHALVTSTVRRVVDPTTSTINFARYVELSAVSWLPTTFLLYAATVGVAMWMRAIQRAQTRERQRAILSVQLARAELNALRSQLHPHFLFNTLNTIAILIREHETHTAARLVTQLGEMLRHVLQGARSHESALEEEIALVSTYLGIEQVRFGDRLQVRWTVAENTRGATVPALVLQPLVENALQHGVATMVGGGIVEIGAHRNADMLTLWISDNGPGLPANVLSQSISSDGVGLMNTRERLVRLYPGQSSLRLVNNQHGGTRVEVRLPFRLWPAQAISGATLT